MFLILRATKNFERKEEDATNLWIKILAKQKANEQTNILNDNTKAKAMSGHL